MLVHVEKLCNPFVQGSELGVLTPLARWHNKPEFSKSPSVGLGFSSTGFCNKASASFQALPASLSLPLL